MLKLGVNIDHVATLRQVRRVAYPDPLDAARLCAEAGAHGLTVHLREDRRHIQDRDVFALQAQNLLPLNLEMGNAPEIVAIALRVRPPEVCLVPERREELTTEGGLDAAGQFDALAPTVQALGRAGVRVSLFIAPEPAQLEAAVRLGAPCVELHTGSFCDASGPAAEAELLRLIRAGRLGKQLGLQVNAGHGINLDNIRDILTMPFLDTLNIGHSIIARAVMVGLKNAVMEMRQAMMPYRGGKTSMQ